MPIRWPTDRCRFFLPAWWPHSWYNTRYGMELLPAFALGLGFAAQFLLIGARPRFQAAAGRSMRRRALFALVALNAGRWCASVRWSTWRAQKYRGAPALRDRDSAGAAGAAGRAAGRDGADGHIGLSGARGAHRDSAAADDQRERSGVYHDALAAPAQHAAIVLAFDGDEIDRAVKAHPEGLSAVGRFTARASPREHFTSPVLPGFSEPSDKRRSDGDSIGQGTFALIRRKIDSLYQSSRLRQRLSDCEGRGGAQVTIGQS